MVAPTSSMPYIATVLSSVEHVCSARVHVHVHVCTCMYVHVRVHVRVRVRVRVLQVRSLTGMITP